MITRREQVLLDIWFLLPVNVYVIESVVEKALTDCEVKILHFLTNENKTSHKLYLLPYGYLSLTKIERYISLDINIPSKSQILGKRILYHLTDKEKKYKYNVIVRNK